MDLTRLRSFHEKSRKRYEEGMTKRPIAKKKRPKPYPKKANVL